MTETKITPSALHEIPDDIKEILGANEDLLHKWNDLTDLGRNEWICWVTIVKKEETRKEHLVRMQEEILDGTRRPCCWPGCPHRNPKSKKWFKMD